MFDLIYRWIDILWLPLVFFLVHKQHRWWAVAFVLTCMLVMRLQVEIIESTGFNFGFMGLINMHAHTRGLLIYSLFYLFFLIIAHFSPKTQGVVFMAACLAIFFMAFFTSMLFMCL